MTEEKSKFLTLVFEINPKSPPRVPLFESTIYGECVGAMVGDAMSEVDALTERLDAGRRDAERGREK